MQVFILILDSGPTNSMEGSTKIIGVYESLKLAEFHKPTEVQNDDYYECYRIEIYNVLNKDIIVQNLKEKLEELEK